MAIKRKSGAGIHDADARKKDTEMMKRERNCPHKR
jgi:hypothetical protein